MADGSSLETYANHPNSATNGMQSSSASLEGVEAGRTGRVLTFVGVALVAAAAMFAIVRATLGRAPSDPTTARIQALIDEANRLLKQLDEKAE